MLNLSVECLPVIKNSGIRKSRHLWANPDTHDVPSSDSSCKQPRVSCAEAHVTVLLPVSGCQVSFHILNVKKGFTLTSPPTVHWCARRKRHLLHLHCGLYFKLRQLKLIGYKRLSTYRRLQKARRVDISVGCLTDRHKLSYAALWFSISSICASAQRARVSWSFEITLQAVIPPCFKTCLECSFKLNFKLLPTIPN